MTMREFEEIVRGVLDELPFEFQEKIEHVGIELRDEPDARDRRSARLGGNLLGFQQGPSQLDAMSGRPWEMPQRIVLYRSSHNRAFRNPVERRREVRKTVLHEIGHFFGMTEEDLQRLGYG